ncbi:unnamed protein product, partial [marine sediment metagenome]
DGRTNRVTLHPHCLRKFFRSYLGDADLSEHLMGHAHGLVKLYRNMKIEDLSEKYNNLMHNVTFFEVSPDLSGINEQMKEKETRINELNQKYNSIKIDHIQMQIDLGKALEKIEKLEKKK